MVNVKDQTINQSQLIVRDVLGFLDSPELTRPTVTLWLDLLGFRGHLDETWS